MRVSLLTSAFLSAIGCATYTLAPRPAPPPPVSQVRPPPERPAALGVNDAADCPRDACPRRAMGMPNWECADGRRGGPACRRTPSGACGWMVVECERTPPPPPPVVPIVPLRAPPVPQPSPPSEPSQGLQDLGTWTAIAGEPVSASEARLTGASALRFVGDGVASIGGNTLRHLAPGDRRWTVIQRQPGDNLYRVGVDEAGERLIAAWEKDPLIHVFSLRTRSHLAFPRPPRPGNRHELIQLESVAFSTDGGSALVLMADRTTRQAGPVALWRVPLDGSGPAEQVVHTDGALLVASGRYGAIFALPPSPRQRCAPAACPGTAGLVAYEVTTGAVTERPLLSGQQLAVRAFHPYRSEDSGRVVIELELQHGGRALLVYRPGEDVPEIHPLPQGANVGEARPRALVARGGGEVITIRKVGLDLEVSRLRLDGGTPRRGARIPARVNHDEPLFGFGTRPDGSLWLKWGDTLAFVDLDGTPTGVDLRPLAGSRGEWAGVVNPDAATQTLWIGVEVGPRRDYFRLRLDEQARRARRWPERPAGCKALPDEATLLRWPVKTYGGCSGGRPNPRAQRPPPPKIVRELRDGTKIIDAGEKGCVRAVEEPCRNK